RGGRQAELVEQGDGRLVVVGGGDERGGADEVTGGDDEGVPVAEPLQVGGEVGGAPGVDGLPGLVHDAAARAGRGFEVPVQVVDGEQAFRHGVVRFGAAVSAALGRALRCGVGTRGERGEG